MRNPPTIPLGWDYHPSAGGRGVCRIETAEAGVPLSRFGKGDEAAKPIANWPSGW